VHGIDIRIAQLDRPGQHLIRFQQLLLPCYRQQRAHGAMKLGLAHFVDALAQRSILHQRGVEPRRAHVHLAQRQFHIAQQVDE
jgi:hypothetical protein